MRLHAKTPVLDFVRRTASACARRENDMYQQPAFKKYTFLLAGVVVFTLPLSVLLHAVIPHNHGGGPVAVAVGENPVEPLSMSTSLTRISFDAEFGRIIPAEDVSAHDHPSDHSGDTEKGTANVWNFVHVSLRHEQKKIFFGLDNVQMFVHAVFLHSQLRFIAFTPIERIYAIQYEHALSRGILAFRSFG